MGKKVYLGGIEYELDANGNYIPTGKEAEPSLGGSEVGDVSSSSGMVRTEDGWSAPREIEQRDQDARKAATKAAVAGFEESEAASRKVPALYDPFINFMQGEANTVGGRYAASGAKAMAPVFGQMGMGAAGASPAAALAGSQVSFDADQKAMAALQAIHEDILAGRVSQAEGEILAAQAGIQTQQAKMEVPTTAELSAAGMAKYQEIWDSGVSRKEMLQRLEAETDPYVKAMWTQKMMGIA